MKRMLLLTFVIAFSSCARYAPRAPRVFTIYNRQVDTEISSGTWLATYNAMLDSPTKLEYRNHLLSEFVWSIDRNYSNFEVNFYTNKAEEDIAGDFLGLGLGGAAVLTGSVRTKTILALVAATIVGGKASMDAHWYNTQTREAIVSQMRALRANQMVVIENGMMSPLTSYSLDQGIMDTQAYYRAGSVVSALQEISQTASAQAAMAKATLEKVKAQYHRP